MKSRLNQSFNKKNPSNLPVSSPRIYISSLSFLPKVRRYCELSRRLTKVSLHFSNSLLAPFIPSYPTFTAFFFDVSLIYVCLPRKYGITFLLFFFIFRKYGQNRRLEMLDLGSMLASFFFLGENLCRKVFFYFLCFCNNFMRSYRVMAANQKKNLGFYFIGKFRFSL